MYKPQTVWWLDMTELREDKGLISWRSEFTLAVFAVCKRKRPTLKSLANNAMDIRRVQGNMPPVGALLMCPRYDIQILCLQPVEYMQGLLKQYSYWQTVQLDISGDDYLKSLTTLVVRLVRASLSGLCRSERPEFEPHSDYKFVISKSHIVLYWFTPSFRLLVFRSKILAHRSVQNKVNNLSHPYSKFVNQLIFISSETTGLFSRLSFATFRTNYSWSFRVDRYSIRS